MFQKIVYTIKKFGFATFIKFSFQEIVLFLKGFLISSYSQHGEDIILDKFLNNKKNGYYIDIGTADPIRFSNTYRFYKKGWSGFLIEPNPFRIDKIKKVRPRDNVINTGVTELQGVMDFFVFNPPNVSTFSSRAKEINIENGYTYEQTLSVPTVPLSEIIHNAQNMYKEAIDFISIDTEGYDMAVLASNDWTTYRPRFVIVECVKSDTRDVGYAEFVSFMKKNNYSEVFYNNLNIIFRDSNI